MSRLNASSSTSRILAMRRLLCLSVLVANMGHHQLMYLVEQNIELVRPLLEDLGHRTVQAYALGGRELLGRDYDNRDRAPARSGVEFVDHLQAVQLRQQQIEQDQV